MYRLYAKFLRTASVADDKKGKAGRPRTAKTLEKIDAAKELFKQQPHTPLRRGAQMLGICKTTLSAILKEMHFFPYKPVVVHKIPSTAVPKRLSFAEEMLEMILSGEVDPMKIWFSDEAHVYLEGYTNRQNMRTWATENDPAFRIIEVPLQPKRVTVWCAISGHGIIGPIFVVDSDGKGEYQTQPDDEQDTGSGRVRRRKKPPNSINGRMYRRMLAEGFIPEAQRMGCCEDFYFMQDGAPPHRVASVFEVLSENFSERVIALGYPGYSDSGINWPPYSCDLNPCDFFLWGYMKDSIFKNFARIPTLDELKVRITELVASIQLDTCQKVCDNFIKRLELVQQTEGCHIEHLLRMDS